jgi:hypothetical protein
MVLSNRLVAGERGVAEQDPSLNHAITVGYAGIPEEWLNGLFEWPRSVTWMRKLAARLAEEISVADGPVAQGAGDSLLAWNRRKKRIPRHAV